VTATAPSNAVIASTCLNENLHFDLAIFMPLTETAALINARLREVKCSGENRGRPRLHGSRRGRGPKKEVVYRGIPE
jgi:hypothetical protein